ncbi:MAG: hypothetical protein PHF82_09315, partial [Lutispora sp.]|nr:hypothetical protein [Lutispora sp.]
MFSFVEMQIARPIIEGFKEVLLTGDYYRCIDYIGFQAHLNTELIRPKSPASKGGGCQRAAKSSMDSTNIQCGLNPPLNEGSFNEIFDAHFDNRSKAGQIMREKESLYKENMEQILLFNMLMLWHDKYYYH